MLQVRKPPGPKLGFRGSLEPNSLLESDKVHRTFRWGWNSILDRSDSTNDTTRGQRLYGFAATRTLGLGGQ